VRAIPHPSSHPSSSHPLLSTVWSLLYFLYPTIFTEKTLQPFKDSFNLSQGLYDRSFLEKSQKLLEIVMLRRTKDGVSGQLSVPPKEELTRSSRLPMFPFFSFLPFYRSLLYLLALVTASDELLSTVYVPLAPAQEFWYRRLLARSDTMTLGEIFGSKTAKGVAATAKKEEEDVIEEEEEEGDDEAEGDRLVMENIKFAMGEGGAKQEGAGGTAYRKLMNLLIQLRKCCNHPYLLPDAEPEPFKIDESIVAASSKLTLLDKLLKNILPKGEKVLIFSGFTRALDILEDYCSLREFTCAFFSPAFVC
jgi:SWI/SNF-related matrix-associated actin-dependent regulator of chromatin subfamily A member 5